ncbi:MAG TPA: ABC-F family ATP-binding cassette domain-containing protein [Anaerolinea sp.]|nr:ABC-F family ATP-binding cassette domain-containing protein [Anaerolinea sp.]
MLAVSNISKSFGVKPVLQNVSFTIKSGDRIALVGPNGSGKTTLLRILLGIDKPDHGSVRTTPSDLRLGYLPQGFEFKHWETLGNFVNRYRGDIAYLSAQIEVISSQLATRPNDMDLQEAYDAVLGELQFTSLNPDRSPEVLHALGLDQFSESTPVAHLSGGPKTRPALAGGLLSPPQLLLLDEPTNHLDIEMIEWLEEWLVNSPFSVLFVSHDRAFIDNVAGEILELDAYTHNVRSYSGNYTDYLDQKQAERERQQQDYIDQQDEISRLSTAAEHLRGIAKFRKGGKADSNDKFAKGFFANRGLGTVGRAKNIEKRIEHLLTDEKVEKPRRSWQMNIDFRQIPSSGKDAIVLRDLTIGYDPAHPLAQEINLTVRAGQRVAMIGVNGAGKSTLVKTIAGTVPPLGGWVTIGANVKMGYMAQEQENLKPEDTPLTALSRLKPESETEVRSFLSKFLITGDDVFTPVERMSYGERSRLMLACLVADGCNLLLLDEPVNHLDIPSRVRFEQALSNYEGTILAVVHDRYFIRAFATTIWELKQGRIGVIA